MPPVTLFLIVANLVVFLLQLSVPGIEVPFALWPLAASRASVASYPWRVTGFDSTS